MRERIDRCDPNRHPIILRGAAQGNGSLPVATTDTDGRRIFQLLAISINFLFRVLGVLPRVLSNDLVDPFLLLALCRGLGCCPAVAVLRGLAGHGLPRIKARLKVFFNMLSALNTEFAPCDLLQVLGGERPFSGLQRNIGKRYRRQDEIGTPFCITYDFESEEDGAVTVRDRDTMAQERVKIEDLKAYFEKKFEF